MTNEVPDSYFQKLNTTLKNYNCAIPSMLIDLDIMDKNIAELKHNLNPNLNIRIPVKSLPSLELIEYLMTKLNTSRLMVFHQPFLSDLTKTLDNNVDVLFGKPMPSKTVNYYYNNLPDIQNNFDPYRQIQWLVDTNLRISQYINLAKDLGKKLRLNIEIDVGLHRGGFQSVEELHKALELIKDNQQHIEFSGFMGYDPHVVKIPKIVISQKKALKKSNDFYNRCMSLVREKFPKFWNGNLTFNGAGSPTLNLHNHSESPLNDLTAGSCFVKPTTFDIPTLSHYKPACFIATPVLKKFKGMTLPGIERFKSLLGFLNSNNAQSFFIYGGFWKADYVYPKNLKQNSLMGASTNQTMVNTSKTVNLEVDDFVFLRPHQSEFVFLQFGKLLVIRKHKIIDNWSLLNND